jgi:hypothetical protein
VRLNDAHCEEPTKEGLTKEEPTKDEGREKTRGNQEERLDSRTTFPREGYETGKKGRNELDVTSALSNPETRPDVTLLVYPPVFWTETV